MMSKEWQKNAAAIVQPAEPFGSGEALPHIRQTVRALLLATPAFQDLDLPKRRSLAQAMVRVSQAAAEMIHEEIQSESEAQKIESRQPSAATQKTQRVRPTLAQAQNAGSDFSGAATDRLAKTTKAVLNAVSFPTFVTDLVNGVFRAMLNSSQQQMQSYVELLNNVSASLDGFAESGFSDDGARAWLVERFQEAFEMVASDEEPDPDEPSSGRRALQLREGARMPSEEALRTGLGLGPEESVPSGDPERLVPFARRQVARQRQQMLSTMVVLGMQRIVIESGRITAGMRFHIDTRSAAQADQGSTFDGRNTISGSGSFGYGPWGVSASVQNTIGYVSTQRSQTTEEMNTDLELNSSVEINFKSDYLPLNRLATSSQASRIRENSLNPENEKAIADREQRNTANDTARKANIDKILTPQPPQTQTPIQSPDASQKILEDNLKQGRVDDKQRKNASPNQTGPAPQRTGNAHPEATGNAGGAGGNTNQSTAGNPGGAGGAANQGAASNFGGAPRKTR